LYYIGDSNLNDKNILEFREKEDIITIDDIIEGWKYRKGKKYENLFIVNDSSHSD